MGLLWGVDLGGTKIEGVVIEDDNYREPLCRLRIPTEASKGYEHIVASIAHLVESMGDATGGKPRLVGFGTPGVLDRDNGALKNSNTVCLNGMPLANDLRERLKSEVLLSNDANCFALAESRFGVAAGASSVFGVIMGTGVGGGIVIDGKILSGAQGIAGEWGHNELVHNGERCYCGKKGCVETVLSGPALERFYHRLSNELRPLPGIVERARNGNDRSATLTLNHLTEMFGKALSVVVNILDPEVVVLGGGVGNIEELYSDGIESLARFVFNDMLLTRVVRPALGDSAGVFGAALLTGV